MHIIAFGIACMLLINYYTDSLLDFCVQPSFPIFRIVAVNKHGCKQDVIDKTQLVEFTVGKFIIIRFMFLMLA